MTCVTYWIAVPHVVWKVRATLIVDWLLLDTLVTASPPKKKKKKKKIFVLVTLTAVLFGQVIHEPLC